MTRDEAIQELAEWIKQMKDHGVPNYSAKYKALKLAIEALQAEPKHGEWKYYNFSDINNPYVGWYECTVCKHHEYSERSYCPNCGAKMKGQEE